LDKNAYHIVDTCPILSNLNNHLFHEYFNRKDVKQAIHAPADVDWYECKVGVGFVDHDDKSPDPIQGVLPQVIQATNRVLISNGDWDSLVYTNGTLLSIQNMTWSGKLGFQQKPSKDFVVPIANTYRYSHKQALPQGLMGTQHYERGLQWVATAQAGHSQPQYQPRAAWRMLEWVLGRIEEL
jgi:carboxypeptidase D